MLDIETCVAEARTLHPSKDGWFAVLRKIRQPLPGRTKVSQSTHHMSNLDAVVHALEKVPDAYLSQASFLRANRKIVNFKSVNCAFVDIDCYSDKPNSPRITPDQAFIERLQANARAAGFPEPSYTTLSGKGVYCKWIFDRPISAHELLRWQALQNVLTPLYTAFGVDAGARDASRVLRVMGSTHGQSGNTVRVGLNNNTTHSFDALCRAAELVDASKLVWPSDYVTDGQTKASADRSTKARVVKIQKNSALLSALDHDHAGDLGLLHSYQASREPVMLKLGTRDHLNWNRFVDLRTLADLRGGIREGSRDLTLFWMATHLAHAGVVTSQNLESEVQELVGAFSGPDFDPVGDRSMTSLLGRLKDKEAGKTVQFQSGSYDPLYTPTNAHLIDVLSITPEEQTKLATIISGYEKLRRADGKVDGRAERRQARVEWRGLARQMEVEALAKGETRYKTAIAQTLGVDRGAVSKLLSGKLDREAGRIETRGRKKLARQTGGASSGRLLVTRRGTLTRSTWANASSENLGTQNNASPVSRSPQSQDAPTYAKRPIFNSSFLTSLALSFPKRVLFSITKKEKAEEGAFARKTKKGLEIGVAPKTATEVAPNAFCTQPVSQPVNQAQEAARPAWKGWGELAKIGSARKGITGTRQSNSEPIKGNGRVRIQQSDGSSRSIPVVSFEAALKMAQAAEAKRDVTKAESKPRKTNKTPRPHWIKADGSMDLVALEAEVVRLDAIDKAEREAARLINVEQMNLERAQRALATANHVYQIRARAMASSQASGGTGEQEALPKTKAPEDNENLTR